MTKGFKWSGFVEPVNQTDSRVQTIYRGNFVMELVLPNALKITSLEKLKQRLYDYLRSHKGIVPECIRVNERQYREYTDLFRRQVHLMGMPEDSLKFNGIPLIPHGKS